MSQSVLCIFLLFTGAAAVGCGGRTPSGGTGGSDDTTSSGSAGNTATGTGSTGSGGSGGAGMGGSAGTGMGGSGDTAACRPFIPPSICSQNPVGQVATPNLDAFRAAISQRWVLCGKMSIFRTDGRDIGLEITADGHWYRLFLGPGGSTVRGAGLDEEGSWDTVTVGNESQPFQLNFTIFGSGMIYTRPVLAVTPRAMRLDNNGVLIGNYVLDASVPTSSGRCP
jgi:hypothetical protein